MLIPYFPKTASLLTYLTKKGCVMQRCNELFDKAFQKLNDDITTAIVLVATDCSKPFRGPFDES